MYYGFGNTFKLPNYLIIVIYWKANPYVTILLYKNKKDWQSNFNKLHSTLFQKLKKIKILKSC